MGTATIVINDEGGLVFNPFGQMDTGTAGVVAIFGTITMSSSYATGGDTLDLSKYLSAPPLQAILGAGSTGLFTVYVAGTTAANGKVKTLTANASEVSSTTSQSSITIPAVFVGLHK